MGADSPEKAEGRQFPNPNPRDAETGSQKQSACDVCGAGGWPETPGHLESQLVNPKII